MLKRIEDIKKALEAGALLSALALSLILPDICGNLENPNMKVGDRYVNWFNTNVKAFTLFGDRVSPIKIKCKAAQPIDGSVCYKLRCAYLHSGDVDEIANIRDFKFTTNGHYTIKIGIGVAKVSVDIGFFCKSICDAAEKFYNDNKGKYDFSKIELELD